MFMLFPCHVFQDLKGFDERYFLYYEDVDICARMSLAGVRVALCPDIRVFHHAQRSSHRNMKYLKWHLASMLRFFTSPVYRQLKRLRRL
jgi:GT2 family glycosyltransferase